MNVNKQRVEVSDFRVEPHSAFPLRERSAEVHCIYLHSSDESVQLDLRITFHVEPLC